MSIDTNFEGSMGKAESATKKATNALKDQKRCTQRFEITV